MAGSQSNIKTIIRQPESIAFNWEKAGTVTVCGAIIHVYYSKTLDDYYVSTHNICVDLFKMERALSSSSFYKDDQGGAMGLRYPDLVLSRLPGEINYRTDISSNQTIPLLSVEGMRKMHCVFTTIFKKYAKEKEALYNAIVSFVNNPPTTDENAQEDTEEPPVIVVGQETVPEETCPCCTAATAGNICVPTIITESAMEDKETDSRIAEPIGVEDVAEYAQSIQDPIVQPILEILQLYGQLSKEKVELQHKIDTLSAEITLLKSENLALCNAGSQPVSATVQPISMQEVYANTIADVEKLKLLEDWRLHLRPILDNAVAIWCSSIHGTPNQNSEVTKKRWNQVFTQFKIRNNGQGIYPPADWTGTKIEYLVGQGYGVTLLAAMVDVFSKDNTVDHIIWSVKNYFKVHANTAIFYLNHVLSGFGITVPYKDYKEE